MNSPTDGGAETTFAATNFEAFVQARFDLRPVPDVPEISLHTARPESGLMRLLGDNHESPYWAWPWAGGIVLSRYILDHPDCVVGRTVLDFGSGSGLVAIAAAKAGARQVTAVDLDGFAVRAARMNAAANAVSIDAEQGDALQFDAADIDVVTFGDVFYGQGLATSSLETACRWRVRGATVLIGDPYRQALPRNDLRLLTERDVTDVGNVTVEAAVFTLL